MREGSIARDRQRGFTLLEVALTILVAGILLSLAVPNLPRLGRTELESSADRLAATMTYLADEASLRGRIYRLTVSMAESEWSVAALAPYAEPDGTTRPEFREDADDPMTRTTVLPDGIAFQAVLDQDGETTAGTRPIYFLPEGVPQTVSVRLIEDAGETALVTLDATRGSAWREETKRSAP